MERIPLEDLVEDMVGKACRGLGVSEGDLARRSGVSPEALRSLLDGQGDEETVRRVAPVLGLDAEKLATALRGDWYPEAAPVHGLLQVTTSYHGMLVNAYLIWDPAAREAGLFDSGADGALLVACAREHGLAVRVLAVTHAHADHVADLPLLRESYPAAAVYAPEREPVEGARPVGAGFRFPIGSLEVETRLTWGHSPGGLTYVVRGLAVPVAVVGDALFAGSMGGGKVSYQDALRTNREEILTLPDETLLCPGHGPLSTVGEEKRNNPFF